MSEQYLDMAVCYTQPHIFIPSPCCCMMDLITLRSHPQGTAPLYNDAPQCEGMNPIQLRNQQAPARLRMLQFLDT
jgi:hypothetical protein